MLEKNVNGTKETREEAEKELREFIEKTQSLEFELKPLLIMKDGTSMSLQASMYNYCTPRKTGLDRYDEYEIGYPSEAFEEIEEYAELGSEGPNTVYPWVPEDVVCQVIANHGGIDFEKMDIEEAVQRDRVRAEQLEKMGMYECQIGRKFPEIEVMEKPKTDVVEILEQMEENPETVPLSMFARVAKKLSEMVQKQRKIIEEHRNHLFDKQNTKENQSQDLK